MIFDNLPQQNHLAAGVDIYAFDQANLAMTDLPGDPEEHRRPHAHSFVGCEDDWAESRETLFVYNSSIRSVLCLAIQPELAQNTPEQPPQAEAHWLKMRKQRKHPVRTGAGLDL